MLAWGGMYEGNVHSLNNWLGGYVRGVPLAAAWSVRTDFFSGYPTDGRSSLKVVSRGCSDFGLEFLIHL